MRKWIGNFLKSEKTRFRLRWVAILTAGATLIIVSSVIRGNVNDDTESSIAKELWAKACGGIGEALAIAAVIAYLVDEAAKRRLLREFAEDISEHIIGRLLPSGLRERMFEYLSVDFVRTGWTVIYQLKVRQQQAVNGKLAPHVELLTWSNFTMENRSPLTKSYTVAYEVVKKWFEELPPPRIVSVLVNGERVNGCRLKDSSGGFVKLNPDEAPDLIVDMPGYRASQTEPHKAEIRLILAENLGETFYTSFDALHPVVGPTFVAAKYDPRQLEVSLSLSFADDSEAEPIAPLPGEKDRWKIEKPILPGQGFVLRWRPRPAAQATAAAAAKR